MKRERSACGIWRLTALLLGTAGVLTWVVLLTSCSAPWMAGHASEDRFPGHLGQTRQALGVAAQGGDAFLETHRVPAFLEQSLARILRERPKDPYRVLLEDVQNAQRRQQAAAGLSGPAPAAPAPALVPAPAPVVSPSATSGSSGRYDTIWTYWNYPNGADVLVATNLESWRKHAPGMKIALVNESNIREYVPDCPEEFFRFPYDAAKSDFVRAALLYHQGGVYMDTDFLLMRPMDDVLSKLETYDIVAYTDHNTHAQDNVCDGRQYSSNWMAGRKGNKFSQTWWENIKHKLTRMCDKGEFRLEKVCCHEAYAPLPEKRPCHVPWAALEHLKKPPEDLDARGPPQKDRTQHGDEQEDHPEDRVSSEERDRLAAAVRDGNRPAKQLPADVRLYCLNGDVGLAPHTNGEVYWQPWSVETKSTDLAKIGEKDFDKRFDCKQTSKVDLTCHRSNRGNHGNNPWVLPKFFERTAYHLFFSTHRVSIPSRRDLVEGPWLLSEMYRRALGVEAPAPAAPEEQPDDHAPVALGANGLPVSADPRWNKIWTYWHYPNGPDVAVQLNLDSWRKHAPHMEIIFVNESNIRQYVPDCPDEFFHFPYPAAKSDFVRASLLYHQGGVYMDTDFLLMSPMDNILKELETHEIVAYTTNLEQDTVCEGRDYSSNWMAGRKGNKFSQTWWENMKHKLTRMCGEGEFKLEKVCCHEAWAPLPERRPCHVPWAALEHLKQPSKDLDAQGPPQADRTQHGHKKDEVATDARDPAEVERLREAVAQGNRRALPLPSDVRLYCLNGDRGLAPHINGEVYWQSWDPVSQATGTDEGKVFDARFRCREVGEGDLTCSSSNWGDHKSNPRVMPKLFRRVAYHLFFSTRNTHVKSKEEMLRGHWLLSEMYRRALGYKL